MKTFKPYKSKYSEEVKKPSKKEILESAKTRLGKVKESLKKFKEDEAKELSGIASELDGIISDAIDSLGASAPVVTDLVDAAKDVDASQAVAEIKVESKEVKK